MTGFLLSSLLAQGLFAKVYDDSGNNVGSSVINTADGGFVIAGCSDGVGAGSNDFTLFKLASDGSVSWYRTYGGSNSEHAYSVVQTQDGGLAVAGYTASFGAGVFDAMILKLSSTGALQWAKTVGGTAYDHGDFVVQTQDQGFVVVGYTNSFGLNSYDFMVFKMSSTGSLQWAKTFGGSGYDYPHCVVQTQDGGLAVAGYTGSFGVERTDFMVIKMASDGSLQWAKTIGGADYEYAYSMVETQDGGLVIAGNTYSFGAGNDDALVVKLSSSGSLQWAGTFGGSGYDEAYSIMVAPDTGVIVTGQTTSFGAGGEDVLVFKLAFDGSLDWARTFGGVDPDKAYAICETPNNSLVLSGNTQFFNTTGDDDVLVLKMGLDGEYSDCVETCALSVGSPSLSVETPTGSAVSRSPSVSTPSLQTDSHSLSSLDACTPLYNGTEESSQTPDIVMVSWPVEGGIGFKAGQSLSLEVYSGDGRLIRKQHLKKGSNRVSLDQGVYFWRAGSQTGKAVVR